MLRQSLRAIAGMLALVLVLVLPVQAASAQEASVTLQSTVTGNRELPRVMYILPWQLPGEAAVDYAMQEGLANELFVPIDRDEFVRGLVYHTHLKGSGNKISENTDVNTTN